MKVYITKYALSSGICVREAEYIPSSSTNMIAIRAESGHYQHGDDWHKEWPSALKKAESMRTKKIASLKAQIARLEAMTFKQPKNPK